MAKELRIPIKFPVEIDEKSLDGAFARMEQGWSKVESAGSDALSHLAHDVDTIGDHITGLPDVQFDVGGSQDLSKLAEEFGGARDAAESLVTTQKLALAALVAAGDQGSDAYVDLVAKIIDTKQQIKEMETAQQHVVDLFDEPITPKIVVPDEADNPLAKMFAFDAVEKAGEFFSQVSERGAELRQEMKNLAAQTGLTGDALSDLEDHSLNLFTRGIGENMAEAVKIMGVAQQQLGQFLDAPGIEDFTLRMGGVGKVFDIEVGEAISKVRPAIQAFGLEGKEAGDLVALTMQKTGGATSDALDTLNEYSSLLKGAGFNAQEFSGVLIKGFELGARDGDKLADTIKETQIRLRAGDTSTALQGITGPISATIQNIVKLGEQGQISVKDVLQRSAAEMERAFNAGEISETMRTQLQTAISGTPAEDLGADLYGRIFSAPIDTASITSQATAAGNAMVGAIEPTFGARMSKMFAAIGDKAAVLVAPLADAAGVALSTTAKLGPALSFLKDADLFPLDKIKSFAGGLTDLPGLAAKAGPAIGSAMTLATGPIGLVVIGIAAVTAALAYFFTSTEDGKQIWSDITDEVSAFWDLAEPVLEQVGDIIVDNGKLLFEFMIFPLELGWDILKGIFVVVGNVASAIIDFASGGKEAGDSFEILGEIFAGVKISLEATIAGFKALKDGVGDVINKISHGDFSGAIDSFSSLGDKTAAAYTGAIEDGVREHVGEKLKKGLDDALKGKSDLDIKLKASIDVNSTLGELQKAETQVQAIQDKLSAAKSSGAGDSEISKLSKELGSAQDAAAGLAEKLQKDVPGSIAGVKTITTAAGETKLVYDVNKKAVVEFANASQVAYGSEAQGQIQSYSKSLEGIANQYESQKAELLKLQDTINKGGASPEQIKRFQELTSQVNDSREAMVKAFNDGAKAGLVNDAAIKAMARSLGISEGEARKLAQQQAEAAKQAGKGKQTVEEMGASFAGALKKGQDEVAKLSAAYAEMLRTGTNDPAILDNLRKAQEGLKQLTKIQATAAETPEQIAKRAADKAKFEETLAANRVERTERNALRSIRDEDTRALKEIEINQRAADRKSDIEIKYQNKLLALHENTDADIAAREGIKQAQDDKRAAANDARIAREQKLGEIAVANIQKAIDLQKQGSDTETTNLQTRLDLLKATGLKTVDILQQQQDLERQVIERGAASQVNSLIDSTTEFQKFQQQLLADVAANPSDPNNSPDAVLARLQAQRATIAARLVGGSDPIALAYQQIFETTAKKTIDSEVAIRQDGLNRELSQIQAHLAQVQGDTLAALRERNALQTQELEKQQQIERETLVNSLVAQETIRIRAKQLSGQISADEADAQIAAARLAISALNKDIADLDARHAKVKHDLQVSQQDAEGSRLVQQLTDENVGVRAALAFRQAAYDAFYHHIDQARRDDLEKQLGTLDQQTDAIISGYQAGGVAVSDLFDQLGDVAQQQRDIEEELANDTVDFWKSAGAAIAPTFEQFAQQGRDLTEKSISDLEKGGSDIGAVAIGVGEALASIGAKAALEQQNIGDAIISAAFDVLQRLVPIISAQILGLSLATPAGVASFGATAFAEWSFLTGILEAAIAALQGALGFEEGGLVEGGRQLVWVNDDAHETPEIIMRGIVSQRYEPQLLEVNAGADPYEVFARPELSHWSIDTEGDLDIPGALKHGRDWAIVANAESMLAELREQSKKLDKQTAVLESIDRRLETVEREFREYRAEESRSWNTHNNTQDEIQKRIGPKRGYTGAQSDLIGGLLEIVEHLKRIKAVEEAT